MIFLLREEITAYKVEEDNGENRTPFEVRVAVHTMT